MPQHFFQALKDVPIIVLSTDQVYDGTKKTEKEGLYEEDKDKPNPVNVYGKTKQAMEEYLQRHSPNHFVALRSSIIVGPKAPIHKVDTVHDTFLHFCESRREQETTYFTNEYRTVVHVRHVVSIMRWLVQQHWDGPNSSPIAGIYNMGGPVRVNRQDMAREVFRYFQSDDKYVIAATQTSLTSPLDISMNSAKLQSLTGISHQPETMKEFVETTFT